MSQYQQNITFIGGGSMTDALVCGLLRAGYDRQKVVVTNRGVSKLALFAERYAVRISENNAEAVQNADVVVLAVKPDQLPLACEQISNDIPKDAVIVSVAAGVELKTLRQWLNQHPLIVRAMPNLAARLGQSATALFADALAESAVQVVESIFSLVGLTSWLLEEKQLSVATAIAGSAPAYYYLLSESLIRAAEMLDLPKEIATQLVKQTALGAAQLALPPHVNIEALRQEVTSSKGTTAAALNCMLELGFDDIVVQAVEAAYRRALELNKLKE